MNTETLAPTLSISPIRAFSDNYIWCLHDDTQAMVVDPGDAKPVIAFCEQQNLTLKTILITHHHHDHTGGIKALCEHYDELTVIGPRGSHIQGLTKTVSQGDSVHLTHFDCHFTVMELPGHTLDHIAFYGHGLVFCGDTLFSAGCGRLFEGTPSQMHHSLNKLKRLPPSTKIYCTHEYTLANCQFANAVEASNQALDSFIQWAKGVREKDIPTLPTDLKTQLAINPFLRCTEPEVIASASQFAQGELASEIDVFTQLRKWKDVF